MNPLLRCRLYRPFRWAAVVLLLAVTACDRSRVPSAPLPMPTPTPTPTPTATRYHVSGVVADEAGSPIANARIEIDYAPPPGQRFAFVPSTANGSGFYEVDFETNGPFTNFFQLLKLEPTAGVLYAWSEDYQDNIQLLPWGATDIVKNLRLGRVRTITAGEPITLSIEPDSSICSDREDWFLPDRRCHEFEVLADSAGTLTIEARPENASGIVPVVFFATTGRYTTPQVGGPGTASVGVQAGERYRIFVGIPDGTAPQRYTVSTSLQTAERPDDPDYPLGPL